MNKEDKITLILWSVGAVIDFGLAVLDFWLGAYNIVQGKYPWAALDTVAGFLCLVCALRFIRDVVMYIWMFGRQFMGTDIKSCTTVEEVEALRCDTCSRTGHWGWCDAPWIKCEYKDRIKEILGLKDSKIKDPHKHIDSILGG